MIELTNKTKLFGLLDLDHVQSELQVIDLMCKPDFINITLTSVNSEKNVLFVDYIWFDIFI